MDLVEILQTVGQYPILALFVWWVWNSNKRWDINTTHWIKMVEQERLEWREYLKERNSKLENALQHLSEAISKDI